MTTSLVSSMIQNNSDADFRAWGSQIRDQLLAVGLTKTADTGQIDWTTVLRPAANGVGGYEIYRFNDALQATRPIFFKLEYSSSSTQTHPQMFITIGTGSNGSGTITGITTTRQQTGRLMLPSAINVNSYCCYSTAVGGFFFNGWNGANQSTAPTSLFGFGIWRSCDDDGTPNGDGYSYYALTSTTINAFMYSYVAAMQIGAGLHYVLVPGGAILASMVGTDINVYKHFCSVPRMRPIMGMLTYLDTEIGKGGTFTLPTFGSTPHTFMALGNGMSAFGPASTPSHVAAMLWE